MTDLEVDEIYAMTVDPRRNVRRALTMLDAGDVATARRRLADALDDLTAIDAFYRQVTDQEAT